MARRNPQTLEKALEQAAQIVADHGDKYLPVFLRLEEELEAATKRYADRNRALEIARGATSPSGRIEAVGRGV